MAEAVFLDRAEGVDAAVEKLTTTAGGRVYVVVPSGNAEWRDPIKLRLLQRRADYLARQITLVTTDRKVREVAGALDIPTRRSVGGIVQRRSAGEILGGLVKGVFTLGLIAAGVAGGAFAVLYVLPSATVTLVPPTETVSEVLEVAASRKVSAVDSAAKTIPARSVELYLEASDRLTTSGQRKTGDAASTGQVTLMNRTGISVTVPSGTILSTGNGIRFRTAADAALPGQLWGVARVGVMAEEPGPAGNVEQLAINRVDNLGLAVQFTVINEQPTSGGTARETTFVTPDDMARLKARLVDRIKPEAVDRLLKQAQPGESIYPETIRVTILDERYDPPEGEAGEVVSLHVRAHTTGLAVDPGPAADFAVKALSVRVGAGRQLMPGTFKSAPPEPIAADADGVSFRVRAEGRVMPKIDEDELRQALRGKSISEATSFLEGKLRWAERPQVVVEPAWAKTLPSLDQRITIKVVSRR